MTPQRSWHLRRIPRTLPCAIVFMLLIIFNWVVLLLTSTRASNVSLRLAHAFSGAIAGAQTHASTAVPNLVLNRLPELVKKNIGSNQNGVPEYISPGVRKVLARSTKMRHGNPLTNAPFVLFRAIGNDLPPRHAVGQSYTNVRFTLEHEPDHDGLDKRWYVNRIADAEEEVRIVQLLIAHEQTFVVDSIDWQAYGRVGLTVEDYPVSDPLHHRIVRRRRRQWWREEKPDEREMREERETREQQKQRNQRLVVIDGLLHDKNLYIMHNNQARNAMMQLAFAAGAGYALPWDGNCFLSQEAWHAIKSDLRAATTMTGYNESVAAVPMARLLNNAAALSKAMPLASEEPQMMFRRDTDVRFNESLRYGRRPKLALLDLLKPIRVGWMARLYSGRGELETESSGYARSIARYVGIQALITRAETTAARKRGLSGGSILLLDNIEVCRGAPMKQDSKARAAWDAACAVAFPEYNTTTATKTRRRTRRDMETAVWSLLHHVPYDRADCRDAATGAVILDALRVASNRGLATQTHRRAVGDWLRRVADSTDAVGDGESESQTGYCVVLRAVVDAFDGRLGEAVLGLELERLRRVNGSRDGVETAWQLAQVAEVRALSQRIAVALRLPTAIQYSTS